MLRLALIGLGLALAAIAAWYAWPLSAVIGLKQALESRDADSVARHVDFVALRANVKRAENQKIENKESGSILAPAKDAVIEVIADDKLDSVATPQGMIHLVCDHSTDGDDAPAASSKPCRLNGKVQHFGFRSRSRFSVLILPDNGKEFTLVMVRRGRRWLLVDLVYAQPAASNTVH